MYKTIGILAHVDAGKTTFSEQLLFHTNSIKKRGRVDHQDTFLDTHAIEKERGITVFADEGIFTFNGSTYSIVDTPGHVDFSPEMERAVQVMDAAILLISAVEGIEGHTETVWELLRNHHIPTFIFINKVDRAGANVESVLHEVRQHLSDDIMDVPSGCNDLLAEDVVEFLAEQNETLFDYYVENGYDRDIWMNVMKEQVNAGNLFPCGSGSALHDQGIIPFLEMIDVLTETSYNRNEPFAGQVYKIRHDENGTRITFIILR